MSSRLGGTVGLGLVGPGKREDGDLEEGVAVVLDTGQSVVPGKEGSEHTKQTTSDLKAVLGLKSTEVGGVVLAGEEEESQVKREEEEEEHDSRLQGAEEQEGSEDEPAGQEETNDRASVGGVGLVRTNLGVEDVETGREKKTIGNPETTIRRESGSTKGVADSHLPHTSQKLDETTVTKSERKRDVGGGDAAGVHVDGGEDKGSEGESAETQRSRIGELAVLKRDRAGVDHGVRLLVVPDVPMVAIGAGSHDRLVLLDGVDGVGNLLGHCDRTTTYECEEA